MDRREGGRPDVDVGLRYPATTMLLRTRLLTLVAAALLGGAVHAAELPVWRPAAENGPLRLGTAPFDEADARDVPEGEWEVVGAVGAFNLWTLTWHTAALHRDLGRAGEPLSSTELREVERRSPGVSVQHLDVEGWRGDLWVARGLGRGVTLSVHLPWMDVGRPHWDAVAERWHQAFQLGDDYRSLFPRGETLVYLKGDDGVVERRDLTGSGIGDVTVALSVPAGSWLGGVHRGVLVVQAPTGRTDTLRGSGGWDVGVRLFSSWDLGRFAVVGGAGYTWADPSGDLLGIRRASPWHLAAGFDWRIRPSLTGYFRAHYESSLMADFMEGRAANPSLFRRFGLARALTESTWVAFDVGQDDRKNGVAPDFSFHLTVGTRSRVSGRPR